MAYSPNSTTSGQNRSTKGASKQRRDLINLEIDNLKELLPLAESVRQRLFQLQIMSLVCIYIRKERYLPHFALVLGETLHQQHQRFACYRSVPKGFDTCKALRGFMLMVTRQGKLLYLSDNVTDYLGHSVEEIMSQGDSLYDLVDPRDHAAVQTELLSGPPSITMRMRFPDERVFICRMNLSRAAKRQLQYQKFVLVHGRYLHPAEYYQALLTLTQPGVFIHPVFAAFCQPLITPESADTLSFGNTNVFCSLHQMDMTFVQIDEIGIFHLGHKKSDLIGKSWYRMVHPSDLPEVSFKHRMLCEDKESSCILLVRMQTWTGHWLWLHTVLAVKEAASQKDASNVEQLILATFQLLSDIEAATLQSNAWIYNLPHRFSENPMGILTSRPSVPLGHFEQAHHQEKSNHLALQTAYYPGIGNAPAQPDRSPNCGVLDSICTVCIATLETARQRLLGPSKAKRKYSRSQSAGKQPAAQPISARRFARHSCTDQELSFPTGRPFPVHGPSVVDVKPPTAAPACRLAHQEDIRVEIPAYLQGAPGAGLQSSNVPSALLALPTFLTPESSPADSHGSGTHSLGTNSSRLTSGTRGSPESTGQKISLDLFGENQLEISGQADSHLPEIEPDSLAQFLRHVESEPIISHSNDPLLSQAVEDAFFNSVQGEREQTQCSALSVPSKPPQETNPTLRQMLSSGGESCPERTYPHLYTGDFGLAGAVEVSAQQHQTVTRVHSVNDNVGGREEDSSLTECELGSRTKRLSSWAGF